MKEYYFDCEFASEAKELNNTLPYGFIDKEVPGCGLTTLALTDNKNTIIAVPTVDLVINKVEQYPNKFCNYKLFGVYGQVSISDIYKYTEECKNKQPYKILVTYDSINKVDYLLDNANLVIDESDQLLKFANMKSESKVNNIDAINNLLNVAEKYKDTVTFISATPVPIELFEREWMKEIEYIKMHWANVTKVSPILMKRTYVKKSLKEEILKPLMKNDSITIGNATFKKVIVFYNSVENIKDIIKDLEIPENDVAVKCGDSLKNDYKLQGINRLSDCHKLPKFLFITSSGYAGIDLYDKDAISIVVSNTAKNWQLIDLNTDLKQAISRQRIKSNPNYNKFIFIYNTSVFSVSDEELLSKINETKANIEVGCNKLNDSRLNDDEDTYKRFISNFSNEFFAFANEYKDEWVFNKLAYNNTVYFITQIRKEYTQGFNLVDKFKDNSSKVIEIEAPTIKNKLSYTTLVEKYLMSLKESVIWDDEEINSKEYKLIDEYYKTFNELETNSKRAKDRLLVKGSFEEVKLIAKNSFIINERYTNDEIKKKLQAIYDKLGIKRKAKPSDLYEIFKEVKATKSNGTRCMIIINK